MIPGPDELIGCPHCGAREKVRTLVSGNTLGARYWTDGRRQAPMLPETPRVAVCHSCGGCYWLKDAVLIPKQTQGGTRFPDAAISEEWSRVPYAQAPTEAQYEQWLASDVLRTPTEERGARILLWWAQNDRYRDGRRAAADRPSKGHLDNLSRLIELLEPDKPDQRLMRAEAYREMGDFAEALRELDGDDSAGAGFPANYQAALTIVRTLAMQGESRVAEVKRQFV